MTIHVEVVQAGEMLIDFDHLPIWEDERLSWKAKGMFAWLLIKANREPFEREEMVGTSSDGRDSVKSCWKELMKAGYLESSQLRSSGRISGTLLRLFEIPK